MTRKFQIKAFFLIFLIVCVIAAGIIVYSAKDYPLSLPIDPAALGEEYKNSTILDTLDMGTSLLLLAENTGGSRVILRLEKHELLPKCRIPEYYFMAEVPEGKSVCTVDLYHYTVTVDGSTISTETGSMGSGVYWLLVIMIVIGATGFIWHFFTTNYRGYLNRKQPTIEVMATVHSKREGGEIVSTGGMLISGTDTINFITFATDNGQLVEVYVGNQDYYTIHEGEYGKLTYQGQKFWRFEREKPSN